jgi:protoporphyrinogen IX oxidase
MLFIKTAHIVFVISWFAGLFYLPRLFVYHTLATDAIGIERFKVMERRLYRGIMTPSMIAALVLGAWMWLGYGIGGGWLHAKLILVALLVVHHFWLGSLVRAFAADRNTHSDTFYRWINEIPALPLLVGIVYLVVAKPF